MATKSYQESELTVRCKAFSAEGVRENRVSVDGAGVVRVYDDVAGHYTVAHSLSAGAERRIRRMAGVAS